MESLWVGWCLTPTTYIQLAGAGSKIFLRGDTNFVLTETILLCYECVINMLWIRYEYICECVTNELFLNRDDICLGTTNTVLFNTDIDSFVTLRPEIIPCWRFYWAEMKPCHTEFCLHWFVKIKLSRVRMKISGSRNQQN